MSVNVYRYPPAAHRLKTRPGDIVLTHRDQLVSRLIAFGQALRYRGDQRVFARWSHVACVVGYSGEIVEALGRGVRETGLERYRDVEYDYVSVDADERDRLQMARFARSCVGRPYGWLEIVSLGLTLLTGMRVAFGNPGTLVCSALAAQMLCRGDYVFDRDPNRCLPADIAKTVLVSTNY